MQKDVLPSQYIDEFLEYKFGENHEITRHVKQHRQSHVNNLLLASSTSNYNWNYPDAIPEVYEHYFNEEMDRLFDELKPIKGKVKPLYNPLFEPPKGYKQYDKSMIQSSTSPGIHARKEGFQTKGDAYKWGVKRSRNLIITAAHHPNFASEPKNPHQLAHWRTPKVSMASRTALGTKGGKLKVRPVWVYPISMALLEMSYIRPLQAAIRRCWKGASWDFAPYSQQRIDFMEANANNDDWWYDELDFSSYDASVPPWLLTAMFRRLWSLFDIPHKDFKYLVGGWNLLQKYFIYTPFLLKSGECWTTGGIPSGSYATNLVGSLCRCIVQRVIHRILGVPRGCVAFEKYMGDDSLVAYKQGSFTHDHAIAGRYGADKKSADQFNELFSIAAKDCFGMKINAKKSHVSFRALDTTFLGLHYDEWGLPYFTPLDLLTMLRAPERCDVKEYIRYKTSVQKKTEARSKRITRQVTHETLAHLFMRISSYYMLCQGSKASQALLRDIYAYLMVKKVIAVGDEPSAYFHITNDDSPIEKDETKARSSILKARKDSILRSARNEKAMWTVDRDVLNTEGVAYLPSENLLFSVARRCNPILGMDYIDKQHSNLSVQFCLPTLEIRKYMWKLNVSRSYRR
jgi:hypothetical protein